MALAGTAKPGDDDAFLSDVKEIEEHEIVAQPSSTPANACAPWTASRERCARLLG